jgi:hypothetical protein
MRAARVAPERWFRTSPPRTPQCGLLAETDMTDDEYDELYNNTLEMFRAHPPLSRREYGSAIAAKVVECIIGSDYEVHPSSDYAMRMKAVIDAVAYASIDRIADEFGWLDAENDRASDALFARRRTHPCEGLLKDGPRCNKPAKIGEMWCHECTMQHQAEYP